jgi:diguanylate cyclase (GGDEF)-like protein
LNVLAKMRAVIRSVPLRWLYPLVGAVLAGLGTVILSALHAETPYVALVATGLFVAVGWLLGQKEDWLQKTAITDPLTGVANRRCFDQRFGRAVAASTRDGSALTLLFVDVDRLKAINDELGHDAGDAALRLVGECLARTCRSRDVVARWGGDEFAVLALWTTGREGLILAQRIRETLAGLGHELGGDGCPTVSIGVAELRAGARAETLLVTADEALYQAKLAGRDRAVLAAATAAPRRLRRPMSRLHTRPLRTPEDLL